jgi:hypothetical protein
LLNIGVDKLAKQFLETARVTPQHYSIGLEPWSLWYQGKNPSSCGDYLQYCTCTRGKVLLPQQDKVPQRILDYVNWDAIYCAMRESPKRRRVVITIGQNMWGEKIHETVEETGFGSLPAVWSP